MYELQIADICERKYIKQYTVLYYSFVTIVALCKEYCLMNKTKVNNKTTGFSSS